MERELTLKRTLEENIESEIKICKAKAEFRNYEDSDRQDIVKEHYRLMRTNQNLEFVNRMYEKYQFDQPRALMTVREGFQLLEGYVDSSDPDSSVPNKIHMFQTAEGIRRAGHPDWMQLMGLIHDMGKMMFVWGKPEDGQEGTATGQQWALGGDTWIVGCKIPDCAVFPEFNTLNADMQNELYNTENGIYEEGCGLDNVKYAYGHDEYLYQMLVANKCQFPPEGLAMARYHSLYPWHTGGAYRNLMNAKDYELLEWVLEFNKYDLYTKDDNGLQNEDTDKLWEYYQGLIDKYMPGKLKW